MARRRSTRRKSSTTSQDRYRKSSSEARVEQITWALLVAVFGIISLLPDGFVVPNWLVPLSGAIILLGSGAYQYSRRWRVSPITWVGGALMLAVGYYGLQMNPTVNLQGASLIVFAAVIAFGVISNET
jgi:hypothetical protein